MNKLIVIAKNKKTFFLERLTKELGKQKLSIFDPWGDEWGREIISSDPTCPVLVRSTGVYGDDKDLDFLRDLKHDLIINPLRSLEIFREKNLQYSCFGNLGIPRLPWINLKTSSLIEVHSFLSTSSEEILIKPNRGQGGRGIRKFLKSEFVEWYQNSRDLDFVLQPYISQMHEYRLFFIGDDFHITLERFKNKNEVVANFYKQSEARLVKTPDFCLDILNQVKNSFFLDYGALDILKFKDQIFLLEVNTVPGIEQLEEKSGHNVMSYLLRHISKKIA